MGHGANVLDSQGSRGFESLPLRLRFAEAHKSEGEFASLKAKIYDYVLCL